MQAFTWLSAYHLQGKEQRNASISSIKQRKGSTIHQSDKRGCMFSQHWMGTFSSCCWMSLSRSTIQQTRGKCPTNQCWAGFKRVFKVPGSIDTNVFEKQTGKFQVALHTSKLNVVPEDSTISLCFLTDTYRIDH